MSGLTIICPNARRVQVKTTPMMLIRQVLDEACLKSGFDVSCHQLQTQNKKPVDLSLPFRLSGIPNNATLEMAKVEVVQGSVVEVALQNAEGVRHSLRVAPTISLFDLLKSFSQDGFGEDLTANVDQSVPALVYMNKRYTGEHELSSNSLSTLGIQSGKCLLRFMRVKLSEEQIRSINAAQKEEADKKNAAAAKFAKLKAENDERERLERERQIAFDNEKEERALRENQRLQEILPEDDRNGCQPMDTSDFQAPVQRDLLQDVPQQNSNDWSFDGPAFSRQAPQNAIRLEELNHLLERVDNSLSTRQNQETENRLDAMMNALANGGRIGVAEMRARAAVEIETKQKEEENTAPVVVGPCDRQAVIFNKLSRPKEEPMDVEEEFFEVKMDDIKSLQKDLRKAIRDQTQAGFVSKQLVAKKNRELKMKAYQRCVIRVNVGEHVIQACFNSGEPSCRLDEFFKSLLSNDQLKNNLKFMFTNQKVETNNEKNFVDIELAPKSTIVARFGLDTTDALRIFPNVRQVSSDEADAISNNWLAANTVYVPFNSTVQEDRLNKRTTPYGTAASSSSSSTAYSTSNGPPAKSAMPKWMVKKN